tara:strand:+ start:1277 stop:1687 length:411 start_codon:yes stop_codon:yes gene_type:complete
MIEDDFFATVKLWTGEEIFAKVAASDEDDRTMLILHSPIIIEAIKGKTGTIGYKVEPWLKTTKDDMFIVNMDNIITLSESNDIEMIMMYERYVKDVEDERDGKSRISRKMGYISSVNEAKVILEKIFKNSNSNTNS